mmetsp:Transcript_7838/g.11425  ORF Transcript_7838/g.11425 Transcript_7838/m.11425 type:complete len:201 (+) Transcript_7838:79-681(+)
MRFVLLHMTPQRNKCLNQKHPSISINNQEAHLKKLLPELKQKRLVTLNLLLQLKQTKKQRLSSRRTPRNINIHRHNPITPPHNTVRVMIIPTTIRTTPHTHNPPRLRHLIIHLPQRRCHLIGERTSHNHNVRLTGGGAEDHAETFHVVAGGAGVHHFDGAACEAEGHGPEGAFAGPVYEVVYAGDGVFDSVVYGDSACSG